MHAKLEQMKLEWEEGDRASARTLADEYVALFPDKFADKESMSIEECVHAVDVFREAAMNELHWEMEAWLLHRFEPQNIGGPVEAVVRIAQGG